jgi:hypothetical protein
LFPRHIPSALLPAGAVVEGQKDSWGLLFLFSHFVGGAYFLLPFAVVIFETSAAREYTRNNNSGGKHN